MEVKELEVNVKRDFNNSICLIGIIPLLVFVYLLANKVGYVGILASDIGYAVFFTIALLLLGITIARRVLWTAVKHLFDFNQQVLNLQAELIEKNRLAAINETALALSHEINNPLMVMRGSLELLEMEFVNFNVPDSVKSKFTDVKTHCDRIKRVTDKLATLTKPATVNFHGDMKMIDLEKSR